MILTVGLVFVLAAGAAGQTGGKTAYIFASSNRTLGLSDEAATRKLASFEEANAIAVADRVACALTRSVGISVVLGVYDKSSENSFLMRTSLDRGPMEYLGSLLGLYERQSSILLFSPQTGGSDRLWIIRTPRSFGSVAIAARQQRITPLTV